MAITIATASIIIARSGMKTERDLSPFFWSLVIIIIGGAVIAFLLVSRDAKKNEISFSCSSEFSSSLDIHKSKMNLEGILLITSYHSGNFSLSVQGTLKAEGGQYVVNRKLFFRYSRPLGHAAGVYNINPSGRENSPDDNAPDAIDYLFFDAYERGDKLYMVKRIDRETVIIGDQFSPRYACVMNHFTH